MNRADRRAAARAAGALPAGHLEVLAPDHPAHGDGLPCPYCGSRTVVSWDAVYRCGCGWSGVLMWAA